MKNILDTYKHYEQGDIIQDFLIDESTHFYHIVGEGIVVLTISTKCKVCFETLNDLQDIDVKKEEIIIFIECDDEEYATIKSVFAEKYNMIQINHAFLKKNLKTHGVPWVYLIDNHFKIMMNRNYQSKSDLDLRSQGRSL